LDAIYVVFIVLLFAITWGFATLVGRV